MSETVGEVLQKGKETLTSMKENVGTPDADKLLGVVLALHAVINFWQTYMLLTRPHDIVPGLAGIETKLHGSASWAILRCFAFQTLTIGLAAGGAAFMYDFKHKAILNTVLMLFHVMTMGDMFYNNWGWRDTKASGFQYNPLWFHGTMAGLHSLGLVASYPELLSSGGGGGGMSTRKTKRY